MTTLADPTPAKFDGTSGNVIQRAEPKVRAAAAVALLLPVALYFIARGIPQLYALPHVVLVLGVAVLTGVLTFTAGFITRAVDRVDLFDNLKASAEDALDVTAEAAGPAVGDLVRAGLHKIPGDVQVAIHATAGALQAELDRVAPSLAPVVDSAAAAVAETPAPAADAVLTQAAKVAQAAELLGIHPAVLDGLAALYGGDSDVTVPADAATPAYDAALAATAAPVVQDAKPPVPAVSAPLAAVPAVAVPEDASSDPVAAGRAEAVTAELPAAPVVVVSAPTAAG